MPSEALALALVGLVGLPGELACSLGLSIKENSSFPHTCSVGWANDEVGYLMPEAAQHLGGYETGPSHWASAASGAVEIVHRTAIGLLKTYIKNVNL